MRWLIYLHLEAVVLCTGFSLSDRRLFWSVPLSEMLLPFVSALLIPALIAWLACPLGVLILACRSPRPPHVPAALLAEAALSLAQCAALLPAVQ